MLIEVNGTKLFFDVENAGLVVDGDRMATKPALILLHGGPGADHSLFKPNFSALSDIVQIIYLDHRGNGRSEPSDPATWNLAQWGDDVRAFADALGLTKPLIYGVSFGGFVAQAYATQHPDHAGGLILSSTTDRVDFDVMFAAFERRGGPKARAVAEAYWLNPSVESRLQYRQICLPLYSYQAQGSPEWLKRAIIKDDVAIWFNGREHELGRMDFRHALAKVRCPTLVISGEDDPLFPPEFSETLAGSITHAPCELLRLKLCGHGIVGDRPEAAFAAIRKFVERC